MAGEDPPPIQDFRHLVPEPEKISLSKIYSEITRNRLLYRAEGTVTLNDGGHQEHPYSAKLYSEYENINFKITIGNKKSINSMRIHSFLSPNSNKFDVVRGQSTLHKGTIGYGPLVNGDDEKIDEKYLQNFLNDELLKKKLKTQVESVRIVEGSFTNYMMNFLRLFYMD